MMGMRTGAAAGLLAVMAMLSLAATARAAAPPGTDRQDRVPQRQAQSAEPEPDARMLADLEVLRDLDLLRELESLRGMTRAPATPASHPGEERPKP